MSFRLSGTNWEGRSWTTPQSLRSFGNQIDQDYPDRPKATDGTVASKAHDAANPTSDHRPAPYTGTGVVRALDATVTLTQGDRITEAMRLSRDPRIKYVIWNRRSFSSPRFVWREYLGAPHDHHLHCSFNAAWDANGTPWDLGADEDMPLTPEDLQKIADAVWFRLITDPVTGTQRGAQALLAAARQDANRAANQSGSGAGPNVEQIADELAERLDD